MTIIEAIKSGRRRRREEWGNKAWDYAGPTHSYTDEDILANDWMIEEKEITISKSKLIKACANAMNRWITRNPTSPPYYSIHPVIPTKELIEELELDK